ncbi:MAG: hypothetical protein INH37_10705 [Myxococcaceae bacterium]|nr:hypothetical protein [Myxococcaceae bacterium]
MSAFTHTTLRHVNKPAHRLGLALNFGLDDAGVEAAVDRGITCFFFQRSRTGKALPGLKRALKRYREQLIFAVGPSLAFFGGSVRRGCEALLKAFDTDSLDVFQRFFRRARRSNRAAQGAAIDVHRVAACSARGASIARRRRWSRRPRQKGVRCGHAQREDLASDDRGLGQRSRDDGGSTHRR